MIDLRIRTFLTVCEVMNFTKTAKLLNLTQPAVTQHIKYLETIYNCKLFVYKGKTMYKTKKCNQLESFAKSMCHNEENINCIMNLKENETFCVNLGATKTIGEYIICDKVKKYLYNDNKNLSLFVDNTKNLLEMLEKSEIDMALIEGYFDKTKYDYKIYKNERFVGVCSKNHPFANKKISLEEIFDNCVIIRENGSGTRDIFEQILKEHSYSLKQFKKVTQISNFSVIIDLVKEGFGISFLYEVVAKNHLCDIATFTISNEPIVREFNYVFLKDCVLKKPMLEFLET